jgi:hypothetical protein
MKSYAQAQDAAELNWSEILALPEDQIGLPLHISAVSTWKSCPCGQLANMIPRRPLTDRYTGTPNDDVLATLGRSFTSSFKDEKYEDCRNLLKLIDLRGQYLVEITIKEIKEKIADLQAQLE